MHLPAQVVHQTNKRRLYTVFDTACASFSTVDREALPAEKLIFLKPVQSVIMNLQVRCNHDNQAMGQAAVDLDVAEPVSKRTKIDKDPVGSRSGESPVKDRCSWYG